MERVTLVGLMGAGKTVVGAWLAERWEWGFVDLDRAVERSTGSSIEALFAIGEGHFRAVEGVELRRALALPRVVIAAGGGAPCQPGAMEAILAAGPAVWLDASPERLAERGLAEPHRPALRGLDAGGVAEHLRRLLEVRGAYYGRATLRVQVADQTPEQVGRAIERGLDRAGRSG